MADMQALVAPSYCDPSKYELEQIPRPEITDPSEVLIQVHAASVNPVDVKVASGLFKLAVKDAFPYRIGYDCAGVVIEVGSGVKRLKVGDEVYARLPEKNKGSWSEFAKCDEFYVAHKPKSLSFGDAAAVPLAAMTALQALRRYDGSLSGKTVFVPAGLGGSGSYACQLAKNVLGAGNVITTVSTSKVDKVPKLLGEGVVDQVIDYTKDDPTKVIPSSSVDFIFDTTGQAMQFLSLVTPKTGMIISVSTQPSGTQLQNSSFFKRPEKPQLPFLARMYLNLMDGIRKARAYRWGIAYDYLSLASNAEDLDTLSKCIEESKVAPVVGSRTKLNDLTKVREVCMQVFKGKGGIGKAVIEVIPVS